MNEMDEKFVMDVISKQNRQATNRFYRGAKSVYRWFMIIYAIILLLVVLSKREVADIFKLGAICGAAIQIFVIIKLTDDYCD